MLTQQPAVSPRMSRSSNDSINNMIQANQQIREREKVTVRGPLYYEMLNLTH